MGAKRKDSSRPAPRTATNRTANNKSLAAIQKKTDGQVDHFETAKVLTKDRIEDALEEFVHKHSSLRARLKKGGPHRPRFRIKIKTSRKNVYKRMMYLKTKELDEFETSFMNEVRRFPIECRQTVKELMNSCKQEEAQYSIDGDAKHKAAAVQKAADIQSLEARLKVLEADISRHKKSQPKKSKPTKTSGAQASSTSVAKKATVYLGQVPKQSSLIGIWKAVCSGTTFHVNVDLHGGVISREGYSEQFKIVGSGTRNKSYAIQLADERWEFSSMPGPSELIWIGKGTGLTSRWTKQSELPEHSGKGQAVADRRAPKAKAKAMMPKAKSQATAPPEGRSVTPLSPFVMPMRKATYQIPTLDRENKFSMDSDSEKSTDLPSAVTKSPFKADTSEMLSDVSEFVEPPRRVILPDPLVHGIPGSPCPSLDDLLEPSKTHLEELIDSEAYADMEPFTKQGFSETAF